jgi:hypothetical protein
MCLSNQKQFTFFQISFKIFISCLLAFSLSAEEKSALDKNNSEIKKEEVQKAEINKSTELKKNPINPAKENSQKEAESHHNEFKFEIASDFIRRGWALGTEDVSRRNNTSYVQAQPVWAIQPTLEFQTPIKHLYSEIFFNIWANSVTDKDNEQKVLQEQSGGGELFPKYFKDTQ